MRSLANIGSYRTGLCGNYVDGALCTSYLDEKMQAQVRGVRGVTGGYVYTRLYHVMNDALDDLGIGCSLRIDFSFSDRLVQLIY